MKHNFKKIVSLVLTVVMLVSMLIPVTVSAETAEPVYLQKNTTATINGVTYRFDVADANDENIWARVNADGSWEFSIRNGDMLWFPDIEMTAQSTIYAEVTNTGSGPSNVNSGFAYGVKGEENSAYSTGVIVQMRTGKRYRVSPITRTNLVAQASDGWGNGGDKPRIVEANMSGSTAAYQAIANSINGNWDSGKTVYFDISQTNGTVTVQAGVPNVGTFFDSAPTYSAASNPTCDYVGGSVGYTIAYQASQDTLSQFRFDNITITNCEVGGVATETYNFINKIVLDEDEEDTPTEDTPIEEQPIYLEKNKTATINGVTYRFDVADANDENVWARVNADGSWEFSIRNGDMLWFPDIEMTAQSTIYAEVTNTGSGPSNVNSGFAYGVKGEENSAYSTGVIVQMRTGKRYRVSPITRTNLVAQASDGWGNGGDKPRIVEANMSGSTAAYQAIANSINGNWDSGKTVYFDISQTNGTVAVQAGVPNVGTFFDSAPTYSAASNPTCDYVGGSVGYTVAYQANQDTLSQFRFDNIVITNCEVGGVAKETYVVKANQYDIDGAKANLSLDGTIGLNFSFKAGATLPAGAVVVATKNGEVISSKEIVEGVNLVTVPVNAKEMTDDVNFSIKVDGAVYENHSYTVSVAEYAEQLLEDEDWGELMEAMLNYGAAAQVALNYKTNDLAVETFTGVNYDFSEYEAITFTGNTDILDGLYMNLVLESDTAFNIYFKPATGVALAVTVNGEAAELTDNGDGYYVLTIGNIAADELLNDFAIVVNGELSFAVNALDWAKIASEGTDANLATLANAMAAYADAAARKN